MPELLNILVTLITLVVLEVILGIDNLVFLAILSQKLPQRQQKRARQIGLMLAWVTRLMLLVSAVYLTKLVQPLFSIAGHIFSVRDLFLLFGGLFLLVKASQEIHDAIEGSDKKSNVRKPKNGFFWIVTQIALLDIIFSLDSVLTAIGLTQQLWIMTIAITIAIACMIFASELLSAFIERHASVKMLALSFLILIGMTLVADAFGFYIPRGYIYFSMGFSMLVEILNMLRRKKS